MKKFLFSSLFVVMSVMTANAQKSVTKTESFSDTQARMLEVTAKSIVRPLVVDLTVAKGQQRKLFSRSYTRKDVEVAMSGNLDNLRSRAIYDAASEWNCDAIVAATFKIELSQDAMSYIVEMKGFPANFDANSWHSLSDSDFKWMEVYRMMNSEMSNDLDRAGAVIQKIQR